MKISKIYLNIHVIILILGSTYIQAEGYNKDQIATFSIVAYDSDSGELGIAVASRFFAVGNVVPWAKADVGAVATQSFANTTFGWRGIDLLEKGSTPNQVVEILLKNDDNPKQRQFGIVSADGSSATYTGENCISWAGGRNGPGYAIQGNILTGENVVIEMEKAFLNTKGTLADRIYASLIAGEAQGGDSRGKQSAAILVVKEGAGYGGYTDRAIDIRVDDHPEPFKEIGRLLDIAQMNYAWNEGWTLFTQGRAVEAVPRIEKAREIDPDYPELLYDVAVIYLAAGNPKQALEALEESIRLNPKLKQQAIKDSDLKSLRADSRFKKLIE